MTPTPESTLFQIAGKSIVVTGAGDGLGRVFATVLSRFGGRVACVDVDRSSADRTAAQITTVGGKAVAVAADVTQESAVQLMVQHVVTAYGGIDVLVNNAGIATVPRRIHELAVDDWDRLMAVNLRGVFLCSRYVLPIMLERQAGSIVNIASVVGLGAFYPSSPGATASYAASKAGVIGLTRQAALEYAGDNIRVNAIAPGWHPGTNLGRERRAASTPQNDTYFEQCLLEGIPLGRFGRIEELEGLIVYLASDASSYVTGQVFAHDGGWSIH